MLGICTLMLVVGGCTTYYKVNDPAGTKEYYTTKVEHEKGGAIKLKDEKSGAHVTLQSSEVKEITEEEYNAAVKPEQKKP
jgi:hypothetical protein